MSIDNVFEAMDEEAVNLLKRTARPDIDADGDAKEVSVSDHTKAFLAVVEYAMLRAKVEPPKKLGESRFGKLFDDFHGRTPDGGETRRRGRPKSLPTEGTA